MEKPARAQTPADDAARAARQFQGLQSEQERLRQLEELQRTNRPPSGDVPAKPVPESAAKGERCFDIKTIKVEGAKLIADETIRATVAGWEGKCLGLTEINNVLKALTFLYVEKGYIASRAYLKPQKLTSGELAIAIVEGKLESIRVNGQADDRHIVATAFPWMIDHSVNLRDLEQGIDQINRLRSNDAKTALAAGSQQGYSVLDVTNKPTSRFHASVGTDNLGATVSGIYQSRVDMTLDNALGINDLWQFGYQMSNNRSPVYVSPERPNSDTINGSVSIPYGYWLYGLDTTWSQYHSSVPGQIGPINTDGGSTIISPYLTRMLYRDQVSKLSATARFTWKDTDNEILGSRIDVASRTLSIAQFDLNYSRQVLGGQFAAGIGYQHGLDVLGAFKDFDAPDGSPKGQFAKYTATLSYMRPFDLGPVTPVFSTFIMGQWTDDRLFGTEQMSFGGYSTIRGVRDAILFADKGALARNEFSLMLPAPPQAWLAQYVGRIEPYVAVDVGYAVPTNGYYSNTGAVVGTDGGKMIGVAAGVRNRGGKLAFDVWYAQLVARPDMPAATLPPTALVQGRISFSF